MGLQDIFRRPTTKRLDKSPEASPASSSSPASNIHTFGLTSLHNGSNADLDIVFVHGLNGHPYNTWCHREGESEVYWPKQLL